MSIRILQGDCREVLATLPADSLEACVTDAPYELGFMGRRWDQTGVAFDPDTWRAVYRVLKPGAHMLAFSGTRTSHRMVCAIEDAGFEIRDTLCWIYGSGFPKSRDVSKAIDAEAGAVREVIGRAKGAGSSRTESLGVFQPEYDATAPATPEAAQWAGWGTGLKPAHEPICLARKPLGERTVAANVLRHGTGALNVDACRVPAPDGVPEFVRHGGPAANCYGDGLKLSNRTGKIDTKTGRWPANVVHDGSDEVEAAFAVFGVSDKPNGNLNCVGRMYEPKRNIYGQYKASAYNGGYLDIGSASRFFYNASERGRRPGGFGNVGADKGDSVPNGPMYQDSGSPSRFFYSSKADSADRADSKHPTVKPVELLRWLVRLITPPGGTVLDCFAGSGTTAEAAMLEGFGALLIEQDAQHVADIRHRIDRWSGGDTPLFKVAAE